MVIKSLFVIPVARAAEAPTKGEIVRTFWAVAIWVAGVIVGLYVDVYLCFYLGIVNIVEGLNADNADRVALGVVQVFVLSGGIGYAIYWICNEIAEHILNPKSSTVGWQPGGHRTARQGERAWEQFMRDADANQDGDAVRPFDESEG
jgi:hypothetical protein